MIDRLKAKLAGKWLSAKTTEPESTGFVYYLSRAQYEEVSKDLKVSFADLLQVIRNEKAMLAARFPLVLWKVSRHENNGFTLSFACLDQQVVSVLPKGIYALIPETWVLPQITQPNMLYKVESSSRYWAYLADNKRLYTTNICGLMSPEQHFLDALGVTEQIQHKQTIDIVQLLRDKPKILPLTNLIGLVHINLGKRNGHEFKVSKKWLLRVVFAPAIVYGLVLSGFLLWYESKLQQEVSVKQNAALSIVDTQNELESRLSELARYYREFDRLPMQSAVVSRISELLAGKAQLQRLDIAARQIVLSGSAKSATDVLALLSQQAIFTEVKFERGVQSGRDGESFVISIVYSPEVGQ